MRPKVSGCFSSARKEEELGKKQKEKVGFYNSFYKLFLYASIKNKLDKASRFCNLMPFLGIADNIA